MNARFFAKAREELIEAAEFLEQREKGLGARFESEVSAALRRFRSLPFAWGPLGPGLRRCRVLVFSYTLI
jgi:hypothetical protein